MLRFPVDPRYHVDFCLQGLADGVIEQRRRKGLAGESILVLMTALPAYVAWSLLKIGFRRLAQKGACRSR